MKCIRCQLSVPDGTFCMLCGWKQSLAPQKCTLEALYETWSKRHYPTINFKTVEGYTRAWKGWLSPYANMLIQDMGIDEWQDIIDEMQGYSLSAQKKVRGLISQLCKAAVLRNMIPTNYSAGLILSGEEAKKSLIFTEEQIKTLFSCSKDKGNPHWLTARITLILIFTGFRPNELFKVRRSHVNLALGYIVGGSKTKAGENRIVPILSQIEKYIMELYLKASFVDDGYLLQGPKGAKYNLRNWRDRCFYPMSLDLGFNTIEQLAQKKEAEHYAPYSARGTFASIAYQYGVDKEVIKRIMGHTQFATTSKFYIKTEALHLLKELQKISLVN